MPITHVNRKGDTYYLHSGVTKTGKPRYHFSRDAGGELVEALPDGYEVYENPNGLVFLRRSGPRHISQAEEDCVRDGVRRLARVRHFAVEVKQKTIVVHLPGQDADSLERFFQSDFGARARDVNIERFLSYSPMMRFVLLDAKERTFIAERWCFRGAIDDWICLSPPRPLPELVREFCPHLGKDSFFELL